MRDIDNQFIPASIRTKWVELAKDNIMKKTDITMSNVYELCFQVGNDATLMATARDETLQTLFTALREKFTFTDEQMRQCIIFIKEDAQV